MGRPIKLTPAGVFWIGYLVLLVMGVLLLSRADAAELPQGALKHRADLDGTPEVRHFAKTLEKVIVDTVEGGQMTKDLAMLIGPDEPWLDTDGFMNALDENLAKALAE